ncbi:MAG: ORF6N domain-containing protein [Carnobacterium sp.]|uniref:ORF6N domain-containing protein n=1 Tax=Carnobacterium sp. TaxID=48221 RepID=UPI002FC87982
MNELIKVTGKQKIGSIEFTGIEGGFGEGKKAMLVKDIAEIHNQPQGEINRRINDNRIRFKSGVDIIDLKSVMGLSHNEYGFTQNAWNRLQNAYILSERGYSKLLKILEDDKAWEIYDELVDNYFEMRQAKLDTSNLSPELQMFDLLGKALAKQELATKAIDVKVDNISEIISLNSIDWKKDTNQLINKVAKLRGGFEAYRDVRNEIYEELERRAKVSLKTRLTNKRRRMADEGVCKSKRDKLNKVDVISDDKKLVEIYLAVVKDFAIKHGVQAAV